MSWIRSPVTLLHGRHQAGLPLFEIRGVGWQPWLLYAKRKRNENDWQNKLANARTGPHVLHVAHLITQTIFWGVESRMHFSMGSLKCQCVAYHMVPTRFTDGQGSFVATWRRRRMGLEKLEHVGNSHGCGQHCLHPTSLASLGRAWGKTLMSWTSRCNRVHHSVSCRWARIHRPCWQATTRVIGARSSVCTVALCRPTITRSLASATME